MLPWYRKSETYKNYWHMDKNEYPYKVYFYENGVYSCKDKFPITYSTKETATKEQFLIHVQSAFEQLNNLNLGVSFKYVGTDTTDRDDLAFLMKDGINAVVYYFNYKWGGLSAPFSRNEFGIKVDLVNNIRKEWFIGCLRHEMTHALGFAHKDDDFNGIKSQLIINGLDGLGEFSADTIHGIKTLYDVPSKFVINGTIKDHNKEIENQQVFIYDSRNKGVLYQSPVDGNGYFEFRIDNVIPKFGLLAIGKKDGYLFGGLRLHRMLGKNMKGYQFNDVKLNNYCSDVGFIKDRLGIKL